MAEKTKNKKIENDEQWVYQPEVRKVEKKEIAYFNGQFVFY